MNTVKVALSFTLAALIGLTVGACKTSDMRTERICKRHCSILKDCNDINQDDCIDACVEVAHECDNDADLEMALERLDDCRNRGCNDVLACEAEAWVECKV